MAHVPAITGVPPSPLTARVNSGAGFWASSVAVARRTIRKFVRTPQLLALATVQSALFLLIFRYIFGGAIAVEGVSYVNFLVPGFVATGILFSGMGAAAGVAEDVDQGFFDRLRSLPIPRAAVMAGRCLADTALVTWSAVVAVGLGFAVGFRMHGSVSGGLAALGLCVVFSFAFEWLFITIGLVAGNAQAAQGIAVLVVPLVFVSSAYVPVSSMPGWLQPFAEHQPLTPMVNAVRGLAGGPQAEALLHHTTAYYVALSLIWSAALVVVFGIVAALRFSRR
ncbi:MAG TPA: ABC transporter permease [Actinomycetes bacterium]